MKILLIATSLILAIAGGYCAGYKKGGDDFAYLDHMMMGMLANLDMNRCEENEAPRECYQLDQQMRIGHSFLFYTQYQERLSPIAQHVFSDPYQGYLKAVGNLHALASSKKPEELCAYLQDVGQSAITECKHDIDAFEKLAGQEHANVGQP